ncbi:MFS general substrate transporter, partial [Wolfiporia cocos MD-104 SS10]
IAPVSPKQSTEYTFPDGGWQAWRNVFGCFLLAVTSFGQLNAFGVFQTYYAANMLPNYSNSAISWIGSIQLTITYASGIVLGRIFDVYGARKTLVLGCILSTFCLMMTSISHKYYQLILSQGIGLGIGIALQFWLYSHSVQMIVPSHWFRMRRATATGIVLSGASLSGIIYPIMLSRLFSSVGFPWAVRAMAFMNFGLQALAIPMVKERLPHNAGNILIDYHAFKDITYLLHVISGFIISFGLYAPFWYLSLFSLSVGINFNLSFYMIAIMNAAGLIGRLSSGYLADWFGRFNITIPCIVLSAIAPLAIWTTSEGLAETIVFSVIFGFSSAAYSSIAASVTAQITADPTRIGMRIGMFILCCSEQFANCQVQSSAILASRHGDYIGLQIFIGIVMIAGAVFETVARLHRVPRIWCKF